jgi:flagellar biosynthesis/type III secretory pathway protein FliH
VSSRVLKADRVVPLSRAADERDLAAGEAERAHQAALEASFAAGYAEGRAAAEREGVDAAPRAARALEHLAQHAAAEHAAGVEATSRAILAAAVDVAEWVLRHELSLPGRSIIERLTLAAQSLIPSSSARVTVAPQDADIVRGWAQRHQVQVVVDEGLRPGDARYESGGGSVDVTMAAALRVAAEALGTDPTPGDR